MLSRIQKSELAWEISLVAFSFFAALMWVLIRYLNEYFLIFQQVFFRSLIAVMLSFIIYSVFFGKLDFLKVKQKDYFLTLLRAVIHLSAVTFWILALLNTTIANATLAGSIPATAILGILFFWDSFSKKSFLYIFISLLWAITISFQWDISFWIWEIYAVIASFLFSSYSLLRKKLSHDIWDREVSFISLVWTALFSGVIFVLFQPDLSRFEQNYEAISIVYLFLGAVVFLCISIFWIYGFKRVRPIVASSIEYLEIPFAILLWYIFFWEFLDIQDTIWWVFIVLWAYLLMNEKIKKNQD